MLPNPTCKKRPPASASAAPEESKWVPAVKALAAAEQQPHWALLDNAAIGAQEAEATHRVKLQLPLEDGTGLDFGALVHGRPVPSGQACPLDLECRDYCSLPP